MLEDLKDTSEHRKVISSAKQNGKIYHWFVSLFLTKIILEEGDNVITTKYWP